MSLLSSSLKNPCYLQDPNGNPIAFCGAEATELLGRTDLDDAPVLARWAEAGINAVAIEVTALDRDPARWINPILRAPGHRRTPQGYRRFDPRKSNPAYWERLSVFLRKAQSHHLFVWIRLLPSLHEFEDEERWRISGWNPDNQFHPHDSPPPEGPIRSALYSDPNGEDLDPHAARLQAMQERWIDQTLELAQDSPYVFFSLGGVPEAAPEWVRERFQTVRERTDAPILLESSLFGKIDPKQVSGYYTTVDRFLEDRAGRIGRRLLLLESPDFAPSNLSPRLWEEIAWRAFFTEVQGFFPVLPPAPDDGGEWPAPDSALLHHLTKVRRFIRERHLRYWTFSPRPHLAEGRPCLARVDQRYLVDPEDGDSVKIDLTGCEGTFTIGWWNRDEERLYTEGMILGGGVRTLAVPAGEGWILDLFKYDR